MLTKMKLIAGAIALAVLAGPATAATTNLVVNGSFEDLGGQSLNRGRWGTLSGIPGWSDLGGTDFEIQTNRTLRNIDAQDGNNYVELDAHGRNSNATIGQAVSMTAGTYELSFYYSPRVNRASTNTNDMLFSIGTLLSGAVLGAPSVDYPHGEWTQISAMFSVETDGDYMLLFSGSGRNETLGGFIDNVSIAAVPLPAGALLLLGGLAGLAAMRRRKG